MGNNILRGISAALFVTVLTLIGGILWHTFGYEGFNVTTLVDIGLVASCITAGYRTGKESRIWFLGGIAALGYVGLSILLAALFLPISGWGTVQILAEGGLIGILAGAFGAGKQGLSLEGIGSRRAAHPLAVSSSAWDDEHHWEDRYEQSYRHKEHSDDQRESEWDQWMARDQELIQEKDRKVPKENKMSQVDEENWFKGEKHAWWDEETGL